MRVESTKVYLVITTHKLVAVYMNKEEAEKARDKIKESGVEVPYKVYAVEYDTGESDERVMNFIKGR